MARQLVVRLGVARCVIHEAPVAFATTVSRTQADAFLHLLRLHGASLSVQERAEVVAAAMQVPWQGEDGANIAAAVGASAGTPEKEPRRSSMQNYSTLLDFFTKTEWEQLSGAHSFNVKRDVIISRLSRLGCRNPTEPTVKLCSSLLILMSGEWEKTSTTPAAQKQQTMRSFKEEFKRTIRHQNWPAEYLTQLKSPDAMRAQHASMFEAAFADGCLPVPCQVDLQKLQQVDCSYRCRGGGGVDPASNVLACTDNSLQQVNSMGNMLLMGMNTMYKQQQSFMQHMMNEGMPPRGGLAEPAHRNSRLLQFDAGEQQRSLVARFPEPTFAAPEDPPSAFAEVAAGSALVSSSGLQVETEPAAAAAGGASAGTVSLLALLDEREHDKAVKAKAAAKAKAVAKAKAQAAAVLAKAAECEESLAAVAADGPSGADVHKRRPKKKKRKKKKVAMRKAPTTAQTVAPAFPKKEKKKREKKEEKEQKEQKGQKVPAASKKSKRPTYSVELTRSQIQCRTGDAGSGQNVSMKFGAGAAYSSFEKAKKAADVWLAAALKQRHLA
jgi:hypothetical protein